MEQNVIKEIEKADDGLIQKKDKTSNVNESTEIVSYDSKDTKANSNSEKEENTNLEANRDTPENIDNSNVKIEDQKIITKPSKRSGSKPEKKTKKEKKSKTIHDQAVFSETNFSAKQEKTDEDIYDKRINDIPSENNIV